VESWYLKLPRPGTAYWVELGLRIPGGQFLPLARSNPVTPPWTSPSRDETVEWVVVGPPAADPAVSRGD
jgi:hypothetical protein